jgi:hypothetical protein
MKIYAPVKDFNGVRNNVRFVNGVGETDNRRLIEWFRSHGYNVPVENTTEQSTEVATIGNMTHDTEFVEINQLSDNPVDDSAEEIDSVALTRLIDFDSMTPLELRDWARDHGKGGLIKNIRSKEKLIEILRG